MKLILDPSAAYEIVLYRLQRDALLKEIVKAKSILAPDLFYSEAANVVWKMYRKEKSHFYEYKLALNLVIEMVDEFYPSDLLWEKAFDLACELNHPVYDSLYLQLAKEQKAGLLSVDKMLNQMAHQLSIPTVGNI